MATKENPFRCGDCNRPAKVLMRIGPDRDDWVYASCDRCLDFLCAAHAEEDGDGRTLCDCCAQELALKKLMSL
jgi:hypothetical protein